MARLGLGIDVKDFDLDRVGFSISVLEDTGKKRVSEGYLRMTLLEFDAFLRALKAAKGDVQTVTVEPDGLRKFMTSNVGGGVPREFSMGDKGPREEESVPKLPLRQKALEAAE